MISVIIVQHNHAPLTAAAVASLRAAHSEPPDVIVVDNASTEGDSAVPGGTAEGCTRIQCIENRGFGAANNAGARAARGEILLFLNNDTIVRAPIAPRIAEYMAANPRCGAAGLRLLNPDGSLQNSSGADPRIWSIWQTSRKGYVYAPRDAVRRDWVSGAAMAVRRDVFEMAGGFDETYFMYYEDVDLCARIRRMGYEVHLIDAGDVVHLKGGSQPGGMPASLETEFRRSQLRYYRHHAPAADALALRLYLVLRYLPHRIAGRGEARALATRIIAMAAAGNV
ncbi:MAG TPA: glycosyltransferase [Bacteroidota bacterium]|nr:glycosyltransferase [Bacteroidota bacterium]